MDPITLATVTAALTVLGTECAKGAASQAGKDIWSKAKELLGWTKEPETREIAVGIATKLHDDDALLSQLMKLLETTKVTDSSVQLASSLVGNLNAQKAIVAQKIEGCIKM